MLSQAFENLPLQLLALGRCTDPCNLAVAPEPGIDVSNEIPIEVDWKTYSDTGCAAERPDVGDCFIVFVVITVGRGRDSESKSTASAFSYVSESRPWFVHRDR